MSEDWSKLRDLDPLADSGAVVDFAIPIAEFPRLTAQLANPAGEARGTVRFGRRAGRIVAEVEVASQLPLKCQRCLAPVDWPIDSKGEVTLVADATQADRLASGIETMLAPEGRISVRDLVEEELLLALPIVPRHAPGSCASPQAQGAPERTSPGPDAPVQRHRPFAGLDELLKRTK